MKTTNRFPKIIGQDIAKRKLDFHLDNFEASNVIPHLLFIAPKGCGKTTLAKAAGQNLMSNGKPKRFLEINCSTLKNVPQFINQVVIPHIHRRECTVLFDEASELPKSVTMMLLTVLNPNPENRTTFSFEDYVMDFDFAQQSFMFATTEAHKMFHALIDRCDRIDLEEYTMDELAEIIRMNVAAIELDCDDDVLKEIAPILRGNARAAQKMANNMKSYLQRTDSKKFTKKDWKALKYALGILPLGISRIELQILRALAEKKESSLTNLSAKTGLTVQCIRQDFELYIQKHNLMEITTGGRTLTSVGHKYLEDLEALDSKVKP
jgi:Holliday junction resolvasome RuvABC ATP-dependent DNA helicase subunit